MADPTTPDDRALLDSIASKYPALAPHMGSATVIQSPDPGDGRQLEFYHPKESDNPSPGNLTFELFKPFKGAEREDAVAADALHYLGGLRSEGGPAVDQKWRDMREQVWQSRTPLQRRMDDGAFKEEHEGGQSFEDWAERNRKDAYVRAGLWPERNPEWQRPAGDPEGWTTEQRARFDAMQHYLRGGRVTDDELDQIAGPPLAVPSGQAPELPAGLTGNSQPIAPPAPPPLAPPIAQPGMVPAGTHAVKGSRATSTLVPSPELQAGRADEQKVIADQRKLAGDEAQTQTEAARIQSKLAQDQADENDRRNAEMAAEAQHQADQQQIRNDKWLADLESIKSAKAPGGFDDWPQEKKVRGYLSVVLGGLASGNTGGVNMGLAQINKQVEDQRRVWTQQQETRFKALEAQHGFNSTLDQQARDTIAQGYARKAMAVDSLGRQADAQLKALGIPAAQQAGLKAQLGLDKMAAEAQQKYGQIVSTKVTDSTQFVPGGAGAGAAGGGGADRLSKLHAFALQNQGNGKDPLVVAEAERLFPELRGKPEKMQQLVAGAIKAAADAKAASGSSVPTNFDAGGKHYVVDSSQTTVREHTAARLQLGLIEGALKNGDELLSAVPGESPQSSARAYFTGDTKRAEVNAKVASLRNAAAAALKESMGEEAGKERAALIFPDLPQTDNGMPQWRARVKAGVDTMRVLERETLSAAGAREAPARAGAVAVGKAAEGGDGKKKSATDTVIDAQAARYGL